MKNPLKTFEPNEKGRDFAIGDLHGSLTVYRNLQKNLDFDPEVDRMFSVGDLVDRGPDSLGTLRLLREKSFFSVLANHEQMMYEAFEGGYMGQFWWQNGGGWGMETWNVARALEAKKNGNIDHNILISDDDYDLLDLLVLVQELPFLMTIKLKSGKQVHMLHAELPPGYIGITDADLASPEKVLKLATMQGGDGDSFVWARRQFMQFYRADLGNRAKMIRTVKNGDAQNVFSDKLSHIISGHTIVQKPVTLLGQTNIDTCAYGSYPEKSHSGQEKMRSWCALTCIELDTWAFYQATETEFRTTEPFVINRADLE